MSPTTISIRATPFELVQGSLSETKDVLLTHLVVWLLTLLAGIFLGLRFFAIWYRKLVLVLDDALLMASWVAILFYAILTSVELALGVGSSATTTSTTEGPSAIILLDNVSRTLALTAVAWSKTAFAISLLGLVRHRDALPRWGLWIMIGLLNSVVISAVIVHWVRCKPVFKAWDMAGVAGGVCFDRVLHNGVQIAAQAYFAFMDFALVVVGCWLVWEKSLTRYEIAGIGLLTTLGLTTGTASILTSIEISTLTDANFIKANIRVLLPASLEAPLTIIIASLPALRLLLPTSASSSPPSTNYANFHGAPIITTGPMSGGGSGGLLARPGTAATGMSISGPMPIRPVRPASSGSFLTTSSSQLGAPPQTATSLLGGGSFKYGAPPSTATTLINNNNNNSNNNTPYTPTSIPYSTTIPGKSPTRPYTPGHKRSKSTLGSTDNLLPSLSQPAPGLDYDYARWNPTNAPSFPSFSQQQNNINNTTTGSTGGVFASTLPPATRQPSNASSLISLDSGGGGNTRGQRQLQREPSNVSANSFPRTYNNDNAFSTSNHQRYPSNISTSSYYNDDNPFLYSVNDNPFSYPNRPHSRSPSPPSPPSPVALQPARPPLTGHRPLPSVREESWRSSAVRSDYWGNSNPDLYGGSFGGGVSSSAGGSRLNNRSNDDGHVHTRSRDSPTLGQWQQRTGQRQGTNGNGDGGGWTQGAKGWTQRVLGVPI